MANTKKLTKEERKKVKRTARKKVKAEKAAEASGSTPVDRRSAK